MWGWPQIGAYSRQKSFWQRSLTCKPSILCVLTRQCEDGLKLVCTHIDRASIATQPQIVKQISYVYVAKQCEAGLKLVPTLVKRASGNAASHCKPSNLCVLARQCEAWLKFKALLTTVRTNYWCIQSSKEPLATQPHITNQVSCVY